MDDVLEWFAALDKMWSFWNILLHSRTVRLLKSITVYRCAALVRFLQKVKKFQSRLIRWILLRKILIQNLRRSTEKCTNSTPWCSQCHCVTHQPTTLVHTPPVSRPRNIRTSGVLGTDMNMPDLNQNLEFEIENIDLFRDHMLHSGASNALSKVCWWNWSPIMCSSWISTGNSLFRVRRYITLHQILMQHLRRFTKT